jgi:prephenate dehydratase
MATQGINALLPSLLSTQVRNAFQYIGDFRKKGINLTRIESIPTEPGHYSFFLDFDGSDKDPVIKEALELAGEATSDLKLLGCYCEKFITEDMMKGDI